MDERVELAGILYDRAVFGIDDPDPLARADRELDAAEAELALARGKVLHGRFLEDQVENPGELPLIERSLELFESLGDERGQAEALFWLGCFHQVVRNDNETAVPLLERSRDLAKQTADNLTLSYALRHLGIAAHAAGRLDEAAENLTASTSLRRDLNFPAGAAANMVGLIYLAKAGDRTDEARQLADEATELATSAGATRILDQLAEARSIL
jgi:tetratricopeptide (TPR) repeat protein